MVDLSSEITCQSHSCLQTIPSANRLNYLLANGAGSAAQKGDANQNARRLVSQSNEVKRNGLLGVGAHETDVRMIFQQDERRGVPQGGVESGRRLSTLDAHVPAARRWQVQVFYERPVVLQDDADAVTVEPALPRAQVQDANRPPKRFELRVSVVRRVD